jgi:hypothetical protein
MSSADYNLFFGLSQSQSNQRIRTVQRTRFFSIAAGLECGENAATIETSRKGAKAQRVWVSGFAP